MDGGRGEGQERKNRPRGLTGSATKAQRIEKCGQRQPDELCDAGQNGVKRSGTEFDSKIHLHTFALIAGIQ